MIDLNAIAEAIRENGYSKVSSQVRLNAGETIPSDWTNPEAVVTNFGMKVAENRAKRGRSWPGSWRSRP